MRVRKLTVVIDGRDDLDKRNFELLVFGVLRNHGLHPQAVTVKDEVEI